VKKKTTGREETEEGGKFTWCCNGQKKVKTSTCVIKGGGVPSDGGESGRDRVDAPVDGWGVVAIGLCSREGGTLGWETSGLPKLIKRVRLREVRVLKFAFPGVERPRLLVKRGVTGQGLMVIK